MFFYSRSVEAYGGSTNEQPRQQTRAQEQAPLTQIKSDALLVTKIVTQRLIWQMASIKDRALRPPRTQKTFSAHKKGNFSAGTTMYKKLDPKRALKNVLTNNLVVMLHPTLHFLSMKMI